MSAQQCSTQWLKYYKSMCNNDAQLTITRHRIATCKIIIQINKKNHANQILSRVTERFHYQTFKA